MMDTRSNDSFPLICEVLLQLDKELSAEKLARQILETRVEVLEAALDPRRSGRHQRLAGADPKSENPMNSLIGRIDQGITAGTVAMRTTENRLRSLVESLGVLASPEPSLSLQENTKLPNSWSDFEYGRRNLSHKRQGRCRGILLREARSLSPRAAKQLGCRTESAVQQVAKQNVEVSARALHGTLSSQTSLDSHQQKEQQMPACTFDVAFLRRSQTAPYDGNTASASTLTCAVEPNVAGNALMSMPSVHSQRYTPRMTRQA